MDQNTALKIAIEMHCKGGFIPLEISKHCPQHAELLNRNLPDLTEDELNELLQA